MANLQNLQGLENVGYDLLLLLLFDKNIHRFSQRGFCGQLSLGNLAAIAPAALAERV